MTLDEMLKQVVNKDYEELVAIAQTAITHLIPPLTKMVGEEYAYKSIMVFVASCVAADGALTGLEKKFLADVMGIGASDSMEFVKVGTDYAYSDAFYDSLDRTLRWHLTMLCISCFAVDEKISKDEIALLEHFLG